MADGAGFNKPVRPREYFSTYRIRGIICSNKPTAAARNEGRIGNAMVWYFSLLGKTAMEDRSSPPSPEKGRREGEGDDAASALEPISRI